MIRSKLEGDQRELMDRRAVLLFGRAQDREVHERDGGVGLEQVAPDAFAGMRLAGDEEDAQVLADAFGCDDDAVVEVREFARNWLQLDFKNVLAGGRERHGDARALVDFGAHHLVGLALAADAQRNLAARLAASAGFADRNLDITRRAVDDAKLRRGDDFDPAIEFVGTAGDQRVHRGIEAERCGGGRNVVDLPVGDHDDAGEAVWRDLGKRTIEFGEQVRAGGALAGRPRGADPFDLETRDAPELVFQVGANGGGLSRSPRDRLAGALVHENDGDVGEALALLLAERRIGEGRNDGGESECPECGTAGPSKE
jgi:hypothetical protein